MELVTEKWASKIASVEIGQTSESGGTRTSKVKVGGHGTLPFLDFEGEVGRPMLALEVHDIYPEEWPNALKSVWGEDTLKDPVKWALAAAKYNPDLLCLRLLSTDPDGKNASAHQAVETVKAVLKNTGLPLIITGSGNVAKDIEILPDVLDAAKGENCLIGFALKENYKTIVAAAMSAGHSIIAETPLDINLAKQLNILITDMGFPVEKIVMHHSTGALGYGIEYTYSVMERTRLAGLSGDKILACPMINFIGQEVWKTKEAKSSQAEMPVWGDEVKRAVNLELATSISYLMAGADILVLNHPETLKEIHAKIKELV